MAHVGTITGSMTLDPSAYLAGLNKAAQATAAFRTSMTGGGMAFNQFGTNANNVAGMMNRFNTSVYASMTAFYALSQTISSSLGVFEDYTNVMSRIAATADLSSSSVNALSESFKKLNREMGGSRSDLMKGVYTAVQANFTRPTEFMQIGEAAMRLRTASGREIDTQKSADVISVVRNALGVRSGREGVVTDMLLKGRDIGRYELKEMASALGIPITVFGNQFGSKLGPEETLRQLIAILSSATQTGLEPRTAATGTRRLVEKTTRLASAPQGVGKNLTAALGNLGYGSISEALNEGPIPYLQNILKLSGGRPEELTRLGFGSREFMLLSSALRGNMGQTKQFYEELAPSNIAGTTDKYIGKQKDTWWYQRDRLRSSYEDSQLSLIDSLVPTMKSLADSLEVINDLFQALAPSIKQLIGALTLGAGASILKNFYVRGGGNSGISFKNSPPKLRELGNIGADFFMRGIRKPALGAPVQATYGNQIYGGSGGVFGNVHPSFYGGGVSPVGWSPLGGSVGDSGSPSGGAVRSGRRDTNGRFVPSWYNIQNAQGQFIPMSEVRRPSFGPSSFRERLLDRASGAAQRMSNLLNFQPSFGSVPGVGSAINAGAFLFGGSDYRAGRIQSQYDSRIATANETLKTDRLSVHRSAAGLRNTLVGAGMNEGAAAASAASYLNRGLMDVNKTFNDTAKSAQRSAQFVGAFSKLLGGIGSIGNMVAVGALFKLMGDFVNGVNRSGNPNVSGGVIDLSKSGSQPSNSLLDPRTAWRHIGDAASRVGTAFTDLINFRSPAESSDKIMDDLFSGGASRGYVLKDDVQAPSFLDRSLMKLSRLIPGAGGYIASSATEKALLRPATAADAMERALRENFDPLQQTKIWKAGYGKLTPKIQAQFEGFLKSGALGNKYEGVTAPGWGQRTNIPGFESGKSGYDIQTDFFTEFFKSLDILGTTSRRTASAVNDFNQTAKQTDHIVTQLKNGYRTFFESFVSGYAQIQTRGSLYDQQASRSLTPGEQAVWQSPEYSKKMAAAAGGLSTPKHIFAGQKGFASFEEWSKQQPQNSTYGGFDEYEKAKSKYFAASRDEQTISGLGTLLSKLSGMSNGDARKQLEQLYGGRLNIDDVGLERLRGTDMSRYFGEKPRDQLGSKSQFMGYGSSETYNSIVSMTSPEIVELQAIRQAIADLQPTITQDHAELLQEFDTKFEKYVGENLKHIADYTKATSDLLSVGNQSDFVPPANN